jgi:tryptophan halogenase
MNIKSITVVGGGSSGWMTASALAYKLPNTKIQLIESPTVPVIGVGESTLWPFKSFLNLLDLKDEQWMEYCDATYKLAIKFCNFKNEGSVQYDILKPVRLPKNIKKINDYFHLCNMYPDTFKVEDFDYWIDDTSKMVRENKLTDNSDVLNWNFETDKAYHLNAGKFGVWLKENIALKNGVIHIVDDVVKINVNETGIESLLTKDNGEIKSDLFIDCTGFKSLLLQKSLNVKFIDYTNDLINNRACVTNIPYKNKELELLSTTDSVAIENGWFWNIPLWNRIGVGYVFSDKFIDDETAINEFKNALSKKYDPERAENAEYRFIDFVAGRTEHRWYKNVVGIGLSSAFLEPLRSTGLLFIYQDIISLVNTIQRKDGKVRKIDIDCYNDSSNKDFDGFKNLVMTEYFLSNREDTKYWEFISQQNFFKSGDPFYENLSYILTGKGVAEIHQTFNIRIMAMDGITPKPPAMYEQILNYENAEYFDYLEQAKNELINQRALTDSYTKSLQSAYEFTKNKIYGGRD